MFYFDFFSVHPSGSAKENADFIQVPDDDNNDETTTEKDDTTPTTPSPPHVTKTNNGDDDDKDPIDVPVGPTNPRPTKKWEEETPTGKPTGKQTSGKLSDRSDLNADRYSNQNMSFTEQVGTLIY